VLEALRKTALESPQDDAPLLVAADQLLQRGVSLGELIALQCKRARLTRDDPEREVLLARERALIAADAAKWLGPAWHRDLEFEFVRGVPTGRFGHAGIFISELSDADTRYPSRAVMRVYPNGAVFNVTVVASDGFEKNVATWFNDKHRGVSRGDLVAHWRDDGLALTFDSKSSSGVVQYEGLLRDGVFECTLHSLINGYRGTSRYTLTSVDGCDTRPASREP
jgi:hypothetical protein